MPDGNWQTDYDTLLGILATRASRVIDKWTGRSPGSYYVTTDATFYYDGPNSGRSGNLVYAYDERLGGGSFPNSQLWIDELAAVPTSVSMSLNGDLTSYTAMAATDYICWPYNALEDGIPYTRLDLDILYGTHKIWYSFRKGIKIVGKFGYSTSIPDDIKQATIIQAARWFKRGQQGFQDAGAIAELGQLRYVKGLDPDIEMMLMHYRRITI